MEPAQSLRRQGRYLRYMALALGLAQAGSGAPHAGERMGCAAVNRGSVNVELASAASRTRHVSLRAGDTLSFTFRTGSAGIGVLSLVKGPDTPRRLLAGPSGSIASYVARVSGDFSFRFATQADGAGGFAASCAPAAVYNSGTAASASAAGETSRLIAEDRNRLRILPESDIAGLVIDTSGTFRGGLSADRTSPNNEVRKPGLVMPLQWEGIGSAPGAPGEAERADGSGPAKLGVKYQLQPAIMIGVRAQFDRGGEAVVDPNWLAGPVTSIQLAPRTALEARAAWGSAPDGPPGTHGAERRLLDARLSTTQTLGALRFSPSISAEYSEETRHLALPMSEAWGLQTIESGRVNFRPEVAYRIDMGYSVFIEPKAAIGGIWGIDTASGLVPGTAIHPALRFNAETGLTIGNAQGTKLQIGGRVEEGTASSPNVWNGRLQLNIPLK